MTKYVGILELLSDGIRGGTANNLRVPALKIGTKTLRGTVMHDELYSLLVVGELCTLTFGRILLWRWLLKIEVQGEVHRCPLPTFIAINALNATVIGYIAALLSLAFVSSYENQKLIGLLVGAAVFPINIKKWLF